MVWNLWLARGMQWPIPARWLLGKDLLRGHGLSLVERWYSLASPLTLISSGSLYQIAIGLDKDRLHAAIDQKGHNAKGCTNIDVREPIQQILSCLAHDLLQKQFGQMPWAIARLWNYRVLGETWRCSWGWRYPNSERFGRLIEQLRQQSKCLRRLKCEIGIKCWRDGCMCDAIWTWLNRLGQLSLFRALNTNLWFCTICRTNLHCKTLAMLR